MLEAIVTSAIPSLIGGIFGKKKQQTTTRVDYQYIRNAASKAGFNPLTALKNGGWANATTTQPNLSAGQFVSEAMQRGLDTWFNREERAQDRELRAINLELARAELAQLNNTAATLAGRGFGYDVTAPAPVSGPQLSGGQSGGRPPGAQTEIPPMSVPVVTEGGETVIIGNQEAGIENPEWIGVPEFFRNNGPYLRGVAIDAAPYVGGAMAGWGLWRNRSTIYDRMTQPGPQGRTAYDRPTYNHSRPRGGGGGGGAFVQPGASDRPYYLPLFNFN
jgi:hypothetical protein